MRLPRNPITGWIVASVPVPQVNNRLQGWMPCVDWCEENVKELSWRYAGEGVFEFRNEADHMMFVLRWA